MKHGLNQFSRSSVPPFPVGYSIVRQEAVSLDQTRSVGVPILSMKDPSEVLQCKARLKTAKKLRGAQGARRKAVKKAEERLLLAEREQEQERTAMLEGERTELECS